MQTILTLLSMIAQAEPLMKMAGEMTGGTVKFTSLMLSYETAMITGGPYVIIQVMQKVLTKSLSTFFHRRAEQR